MVKFILVNRTIRTYIKHSELLPKALSQILGYTLASYKFLHSIKTKYLKGTSTKAEDSGLESNMTTINSGFMKVSFMITSIMDGVELNIIRDNMFRETDLAGVFTRKSAKIVNNTASFMRETGNTINFKELESLMLKKVPYLHFYNKQNSLSKINRQAKPTILKLNILEIGMRESYKGLAESFGEMNYTQDSFSMANIMDRES